MIKINAKWLLEVSNIRAITLWIFVLFKDKKDFNDEVLITHERIHIRQQTEMLIVFFIIWYFTEYLIRLFMYKNSNKAYRNISFEREAYANESNPNYFKDRKLWQWTKYLKNHENK